MQLLQRCIVREQGVVNTKIYVAFRNNLFALNQGRQSSESNRTRRRGRFGFNRKKQARTDLAQAKEGWFSFEVSVWLVDGAAADHRAHDPNLAVLRRRNLCEVVEECDEIGVLADLKLAFFPSSNCANIVPQRSCSGQRTLDATQANPVFSSAHVGGWMPGLRRSDEFGFFPNAAHSRAQKAIQRRHRKRL